MSTVSELVEQACRHSGIDSTTGTDDRNEALRALNRAYKRIIAEAHANKAYATLAVPANTNQVSIATALPGIVIESLDTVYYAPVGGQQVELDPRPRGEVMRILSGGGSVPTAYSFGNIGQTISLDAVSTTGTIPLAIAYSGRPAPLVEGGAESSILINPFFHEDLLGSMATCYILEGYEGQEERAAYYRALLRETMQLYRESTTRNRGKRVPSDHGGRWPTPGPVSAR